MSTPWRLRHRTIAMAAAFLTSLAVLWVGVVVLLGPESITGLLFFYYDLIGLDAQPAAIEPRGLQRLRPSHHRGVRLARRRGRGLVPLHQRQRPDRGEPFPSGPPSPAVAVHDTRRSLPRRLLNGHGEIDGIVCPHEPATSDINGLVERPAHHDLVIAATVNSTSGQAKLIQRLHRSSTPLVTVAMREPQDLTTYREVVTHVCTYSSHRSSLTALTEALFGNVEFAGHLPVAIPDLYPIGHGL